MQVPKIAYFVVHHHHMCHKLCIPGGPHAPKFMQISENGAKKSLMKRYQFISALWLEPLALVLFALFAFPQPKHKIAIYLHMHFLGHRFAEFSPLKE